MTPDPDLIELGRLSMRRAFMDLVDIALDADADWVAVSACQHRFWSGNQEIKAALSERVSDHYRAQASEEG